MHNARIVPDLPFAEYAATPGINASALKIVHQFSLAHARAHLDGTFAKESRALDIGRAFHALALEGRQDFVVRPSTYEHPKEGARPWNSNASVCKEWLAANDGALVLTESDAQDLTGMMHAVSPHLTPYAKPRCELSVFAEREGLPVKVRVDCLPDGADEPVIDLKTCRNAHPEKFMRDALALGYHLQAAWTLDVLRKAGIRRREFRLIAVEVSPPYATCILRFVDTELSALRMGRARANAAFQRIVTAQRTGLWDGYGIHEAEEFIPAWYKAELEQTA